MIANRLSVLLAERQLTIKDVVEKTGLSRNTISNLINKNTSSSISIKTLNTLCMFLNITPSDFYVYSPYELSFEIKDFDSYTEYRTECLFITTVQHGEQSFTIEDPLTLHVLDDRIEILFGFDDPIDKREEGIFDNSVAHLIDNDLNIMFRKSIKDKIETLVESYMVKGIPDSPRIIFNYPWCVKTINHDSEKGK